MTLLIAILGWAAFALNLLGNELLTRKRTFGWPVRLLANAAWLVYSFGTFTWPLFVNHLVFSVSNARGWAKWRRDDHARVGDVSAAVAKVNHQPCMCPGCIANGAGT